MSSMNFLEKLLNGVAVEWVEVGELISPQRGRRLVKSQLAEVGRYAVYQNSMKPLGYYHESNAQAGATFVIVAGAAGEIGFSDVAFWAADDVYFFPEANAVNNKYLYHFLLTKQHEISSQVRRASIPRLSIAAVEKLEIPIPCPENTKKSLEIQAEIVRILDEFTVHTAELNAKLNAELNARKKQYYYYRDQLLSFEEEEVEWNTLGSVAKIGTGSHDTQDAIEDGDYVFYARGREPLRLNVFDFDETAIITAGDGAGVGKVFHYAQGKYALHQRAYRIVPGEVMNPRFVYHCMASHFYAYIQKASVSSSVTSLRRPMFLNFPIPVPELTEQIRIGATLDRFEGMTNSIGESLLREIELRQKQYEYYRDLLLSFPKQEKVEA
ncbi:TPA: restriction endonuclease subunit S [Pseudomonas putida]|uniref:restriction endonuclease subunit S n=1 Tax=Pseudomonas putida TaxID=303 RepID=UPI00236344E3|nr:restriction endonuclease subunit S [Pseudomonas putida]MDD2151863.1 restriction endonuclease subunit S [Pseudomonas putida]HDS1680173.1 restriction endonuclease subunit S [Pseudomonas putida]